MTTRYGYFLSSGEHPPQELVRQAKLAYTRQVLPRRREG